LLVQKYFESRQSILEEHLHKYVDAVEDAHPKLKDAVNHILFADGMRWYPLMVFAVHEMLKGKKNVNTLNPVIPCACALEMVNKAMVIHSSLPNLNNVETYYEKKSTHLEYEPATAILAGDALITMAYGVLTEITDKQKAILCIRTISRTLSSHGYIGGEAVDQISVKKNIRINVLKYIYMKKMGSLLQAGTEMACIVNGTDENLMITLGNFAMNIGLAYYIVNDILGDIGSMDEDEPEVKIKRKNKADYPGLIGLEKSKKYAEKLINDSIRMIKNMPHNEVLMEFVNIIKDRLP
jgi:geranylgeranyl diphosphate synthase type II